MKKLLTILFLFYVLVIFSFGAYAQTNATDSLKVDSLKKVLQTQKEDTNKVNTLNELVNGLRYNNDLRNSIKYANEAILLAEKIDFKKGRANTYINIGWAYYIQSNYPEAIKNALISLKLWEELKDKRNQAIVYLFLQGAYGMQGNYSENLKNAYTALKLFEEMGDQENIAFCFAELSNIYFSHDNPSQGLDNATKALNIFQNISNKFGIAYCYTLIGSNYLNQKNYKEALDNEFAALRLFKELKSRAEYRRHNYACYNIIGSIYEAQGDSAYKEGNKVTALSKFTQAEKNYLTALKGYQEIEYKDFTAILYINLGGIKIKLKELSEASNYLNKSLELAKLVGFKDAIRDSYSGLVILDSIQLNYKQAYEHYKMYILYRDSILNQESLQKALQSKMQYEFDKKEAITKAEQKRKDAEAKRITNIQYFSIATLGIIVLAVVIVAFIQYRNNKQKQKANALLQQQKEKVESTLTELKSTQAQLIQSEKMASLGQLTAGIAHEIQNPLNFVNNFSEINTELIKELEEEADKGNIDEIKAITKDLKDNEQKIIHHGKRADSIVKGMLQHSRASTGKKELTNINALVDECLRLSYHGMRAKDKEFNAAIKTDLDESLSADEAGIGKVNVIPQDISRVVLNLLNNAFYAVDEKKRQLNGMYEPAITVCTKKLDGKVEIHVKENGNGIPQNIVDKIFQPFFTTKPTGQGTGLGLSLSYDIVKAHGGEIKVESKEGEGSEFIVQMPIS